jgi:LemA protein
MSKSNLILVSILGFFLLLAGFAGCGYNGMVNKEEAVESAWAQVENQYQRRSDLIPNIVNTVKGSANFEQSTLTAVVEARAKATSVTIDPKNLSEEELGKFDQAQGELSRALGRLMMITENYPELKSVQAFRDLTVQLEGTENRIAIERKNFNSVVQTYNSTIRRFPNNIVAGIFGFDKKGYFKSAEGSDVAPKVDFGAK